MSARSFSPMRNLPNNGVPVALHIGREVAEIVPTMEASVRAVTEQILQTGEAVSNHEFCGETTAALGCRRYWNESWYPVRDGEGKIIGFGAVVEEITARKKSEETVARLAAIVESSHDALFSENLDGMITSWNRGAEQIFGYLAEEIVGTSIMRLMPTDRQAAEHELQRQIVAGDRGGTFETIRLTKEGREFPTSITIAPLKDAAGKVIGTSRVLRDITERTRVEEALRENAVLFSTLIAQAPMGTYVVDDQFRMRQINAEAISSLSRMDLCIIATGAARCCLRICRRMRQSSKTPSAVAGIARGNSASGGAVTASAGGFRPWRRCARITRARPSGWWGRTWTSLNA